MAATKNALLCHCGTLRVSLTKAKKTAAIYQKRAILLALWLF